MSNFHVFGEGKVTLDFGSDMQTNAAMVCLTDTDEAGEMDVEITPPPDKEVPLHATTLYFPTRESMARIIGYLTTHMNSHDWPEGEKE